MLIGDGVCTQQQLLNRAIFMENGMYNYLCYCSTGEVQFVSLRVVDQTFLVLVGASRAVFQPSARSVFEYPSTIFPLLGG